MRARAATAMTALRNVFQGLLRIITDLVSNSPDPRDTQKITYSMEELIAAVLLMFITDEAPTRNRFNGKRSVETARNTLAALGLKTPHLDTADRVIRLIPEDWFEGLRRDIVCHLLKRKMLRNLRFLGEFYGIAIDATGVHKASVDDEGVTVKESKNGHKTAQRSVLEAKMILGKGLAISVGSEWIVTGDGKTKQDCELNAFKRLAKRIKSQYKRLRVMILADGLYPSTPFFELVESFGWEATCVLKDKKLGQFWNQIDDLHQKQAEGVLECNGFFERIVEGNLETELEYDWHEEINWNGLKLSWAECVACWNGKESSRFVYISTLQLKPTMISEFIAMGRSRWGIEDAFNRQKNRQRALGHKTARDFETLKKYHILGQIAEIIKQLVERSSDCEPLLARSKDTLAGIWQSVSYYFTSPELIRLPSIKKNYSFAKTSQ